MEEIDIHRSADRRTSGKMASVSSTMISIGLGAESHNTLPSIGNLAKLPFRLISVLYEKFYPRR